MTRQRPRPSCSITSRTSPAARTLRAADAQTTPPAGLLTLTILDRPASVILFPFLAGARPRGLTILPLLAMAAMLGFGIYMTWDISHAFAGALAVGPRRSSTRCRSSTHRRGRVTMRVRRTPLILAGTLAALSAGAPAAADPDPGDSTLSVSADVTVCVDVPLVSVHIGRCGSPAVNPPPKAIPNPQPAVPNPQPAVTLNPQPVATPKATPRVRVVITPRPAKPKPTLRTDLWPPLIASGCPTSHPRPSTPSRLQSRNPNQRSSRRPSPR